MKVLNINFAVLLPFLLRDAMLSRHAVSVRLFVRVSVTFVHSVKTNNHIFNFLHSGSHTIFIVSVPNVIAIF